MIEEIQPLVTVYMPTHNRRTLLERALKSVINQTYKNLEIIVVDDGSTDDTERFMQEFMDEYPNVKYLKHDTPKGANVARNYALRESTGYFVTGMDDDDEMVLTRIEKLVNIYDDHFAYVFSIYNNINDDGLCRVWGPSKDVITLDDMLYRNVTGNQILTTKKMFFDAGLFDETLASAQDYDMWIRMLKVKPVARVVSIPLYNVYEHSHERITTSNKQMQGYFQCFLKHRSLMKRQHRKENVRRFASINAIESRDIKNKHLYDCIDLPRLYAGHYKRKLIAFLKIQRINTI